MNIPSNVIANADDLGLTPSVNRAILYCYQNGYINSSSLMTNTAYFDDTVKLIHQNQIITNVGVHVDLAEGKPLINFNNSTYLTQQGNWDFQQTNKKLATLNAKDAEAFKAEIFAQIDKALSANITITHIDSHYHLHTLPRFYNLFFQAAKRYNLKLRLAQTYNEGSLLKFAYRLYINRLFKQRHLNYSHYFETVDHFLGVQDHKNPIKVTEVMLHPDFDINGILTDHYDADTIVKWLNFLGKSIS